MYSQKENVLLAGSNIRTGRADQKEISLLLPRSISSRQLQEAEKTDWQMFRIENNVQRII